jgi:uridine kinase
MDGVIAFVAASIEAVAPSTGRALVAVDGIGASGKSTFAGSLAMQLTGRPVAVLHLDDFFNPPAIRHARGRHSPEGFWLDTYNYDALTSHALDPLKNGNGRYRPSAASPSDGPQWLQAPEDAVMLIEGTFLHRDELRHYWDFSIYLHVPFAVAAQRMTARGTVKSPDDPLLQRYFGAQGLYFEQAHPCERASLVIDNSDYAHPFTIERRR